MAAVTELDARRALRERRRAVDAAIAAEVARRERESEVATSEIAPRLRLVRP